MLLCEIFKKQLKVFDRVGYFLPPDNWPLFQTSVFDQTYLLTPRLLQTAYVNALILESRSIIISIVLTLKSSEKFWNFDFFRNFRTSELSQTTPLPQSEISKPPPPHLPDVLCRRPLTQPYFIQSRAPQTTVLSMLKVIWQNWAKIWPHKVSAGTRSPEPPQKFGHGP